VCKKTVKILLENGAKAAVLDDANQAPIDRALLVESAETAELLLQAEPDWSVRHFGSRDSDGRTLMHACVERELNESVLFLLRHSVSLYDSDFKEVRPLDLLLESNNAQLLHRIFQFKLVRMFRRSEDATSITPTESPKAQLSLVRDVFEMLKMIDSTGRSFLLIVQELRRLGLIQSHHASETVRQAFSIKALEECINEQNLKKFLELMRQMPEFCLSRKLMEGESGQRFMELFTKKAYIEENFDLMQVLMHVMGDVTPVDITQRIERNYLFTLYKECEENGQGVWTYVRDQLDFSNEDAFWRSLQYFLAHLTGIETAEPDARLCQINQFRIFLNPIRTYIVWTVITGKYQRSFLNLCMRQFDIIPLGLYAVKVLRSLCRLSVITTGVREGLEERADSMEQLLKAALQEVFINDRSQRKTVTCDFIRLKLT
uniref:ANK_REP_REGION domain-containing protein n=1 Tax=Macrostomum lignano TaxID=282301 RepID=A0A1I8GY91_9PLAT